MIEKWTNISLHWISLQLLLQNGYQTKFVYMSEFESFDSIWPIIVLWTVFLSVSRHSRMVSCSFFRCTWCSSILISVRIFTFQTFLSLMPLLILFALFALTCDAARVKTTPKKGAAGSHLLPAILLHSLHYFADCTVKRERLRKYPKPLLLISQTHSFQDRITQFQL